MQYVTIAFTISFDKSQKPKKISLCLIIVLVIYHSREIAIMIHGSRLDSISQWVKNEKKTHPNIDHFSDLLFTVLPAKVAQNCVSIMWIQLLSIYARSPISGANFFEGSLYLHYSKPPKTLPCLPYIKDREVDEVINHISRQDV